MSLMVLSAHVEAAQAACGGSIQQMHLGIRLQPVAATGPEAAVAYTIPWRLQNSSMHAKSK
jgi:hypothetical protein